MCSSSKPDVSCKDKWAGQQSSQIFWTAVCVLSKRTQMTPRTSRSQIQLLNEDMNLGLKEIPLVCYLLSLLSAFAPSWCKDTSSKWFLRISYTLLWAPATSFRAEPQHREGALHFHLWPLDERVVNSAVHFREKLISVHFHIRWGAENSGLADQADRLQAEIAHRVRMFSGMILFMNSEHEFLRLSVEEKYMK